MPYSFLIPLHNLLIYLSSKALAKSSPDNRLSILTLAFIRSSNDGAFLFADAAYLSLDSLPLLTFAPLNPPIF